MNNNIMKFAVDSDVKGILKKIGSYENIVAGKIECTICQQLLTLQNLQIIYKNKENDYSFVCDNPYCIEQYLESKKDI